MLHRTLPASYPPCAPYIPHDLNRARRIYCDIYIPHQPMHQCTNAPMPQCPGVAGGAAGDTVGKAAGYTAMSLPIGRDGGVPPSRAIGAAARKRTCFAMHIPPYRCPAVLPAYRPDGCITGRIAIPPHSPVTAAPQHRVPTASRFSHFGAQYQPPEAPSNIHPSAVTGTPPGGAGFTPPPAPESVQSGMYLCRKIINS